MRRTNIDKLEELFGSLGDIAEACSINQALLTRWKKPISWRDANRNRGNDGRIPTRYNGAIRAEAARRARGLPAGEAMNFIDAVGACLDADTCPTCGGPIDAGRIL